MSGDLVWRNAPPLYKRAVHIYVEADLKRRKTRARNDLVTAFDAAEKALQETQRKRDPDLIVRIGDFVRRYGA